MTPIEEDDDEEGAVAAEFQFQWDELALGPATWHKSNLREAGEAMRDELRPKLTLPTALLAKDSAKKVLATHSSPGPPSRAASRAASRASRQKAIDDGKVNLALGWTTRAISSRSSIRNTPKAITNKPAGAMRPGRVDSPLQTKKIANTVI